MGLIDPLDDLESILYLYSEPSEVPYSKIWICHKKCFKTGFGFDCWKSARGFLHKLAHHNSKVDDEQGPVELAGM